MAFQLDQRTEAIRVKLNATYRLRAEGAKLKRLPNGDHEPVGAGAIVCDIIDLTTGELYVSQRMSLDSPGAGELACVQAAFQTALQTAPPLTPAQKASAGFAQARAEIEASQSRLAAERESLASERAEMEKRIAALTEEINALKSSVSEESDRLQKERAAHSLQKGGVMAKPRAPSISLTQPPSTDGANQT